MSTAQQINHFDILDKPVARLPMIWEVIRATAASFEVTPEAIVGRRRHRGLAGMRHVAMYIALGRCGRSSVRVGREFDRHHSTVLYGCEIVEALLTGEKGPLLSARIGMINRALDRITAGGG